MTSKSEHRRPIPGADLVLALLACAFIIVLSAAWRRSVPHAPAVSRSADVAAVRTPPWPVVRIDINAAPEARLMLLPGIGPGLARRIVADRQANGPFAGLDDLQRVRGIGPITVERLGELADAGQLYAKTIDAPPATSGGGRE